MFRGDLATPGTPATPADFRGNIPALVSSGGVCESDDFWTGSDELNLNGDNEGDDNGRDDHGDMWEDMWDAHSPQTLFFAIRTFLRK